jgi:hypothetical protein
MHECRDEREQEYTGKRSVSSLHVSKSQSGEGAEKMERVAKPGKGEISLGNPGGKVERDVRRYPRPGIRFDVGEVVEISNPCWRGRVVKRQSLGRGKIDVWTFGSIETPFGREENKYRLRFVKKVDKRHANAKWWEGGSKRIARMRERGLVWERSLEATGGSTNHRCSCFVLPLACS